MWGFILKMFSSLTYQKRMTCKQQSTLCVEGNTEDGAVGKLCSLIFFTFFTKSFRHCSYFWGSSLLCYGFRGTDDRGNYIKEDPRIVGEQSNMIWHPWPFFWFFERLLTLRCRAMSATASLIVPVTSLLYTAQWIIHWEKKAQKYSTMWDVIR